MAYMVQGNKTKSSYTTFGSIIGVDYQLMGRWHSGIA